MLVMRTRKKIETRGEAAGSYISLSRSTWTMFVTADSSELKVAHRGEGRSEAQLESLLLAEVCQAGPFSV